MVLIGGSIAILLLVAGAAIYLPATDVGTQRLGIVVGLASPVVLALVAALRADRSASVSEATKVDTGQLLDGILDQKLHNTIQAALAEHDATVHGHDPSHPLAPVPVIQSPDSPTSVG